MRFASKSSFWSILGIGQRKKAADQTQFPRLIVLVNRRAPFRVAQRLTIPMTNVTSNNAFERTVMHRGRAVLALNGVLAGAEMSLCQAAQLGR